MSPLSIIKQTNKQVKQTNTQTQKSSKQLTWNWNDWNWNWNRNAIQDLSIINRSIVHKYLYKYKSAQVTSHVPNLLLLGCLASNDSCSNDKASSTTPRVTNAAWIPNAVSLILTWCFYLQDLWPLLYNQFCPTLCPKNIAVCVAYSIFCVYVAVNILYNDNKYKW